jgi:hypothetical protein
MSVLHITLCNLFVIDAAIVAEHHCHVIFCIVVDPYISRIVRERDRADLARCLIVENEE